MQWAAGKVCFSSKNTIYPSISISSCLCLRNTPARTILLTRASRSKSQSLPTISVAVPKTAQMTNCKQRAPQLEESCCSGVRMYFSHQPPPSSKSELSPCAAKMQFTSSFKREI